MNAPRPRPRFQFSIRTMLVATVVCAVVAGAGASLQAPLLARTVIVVYFMALAIYGVLGVARGWRALRDAHAYRRRLRAECEELSKGPRRRDPS